MRYSDRQRARRATWAEFRSITLPAVAIALAIGLVMRWWP
jgi:hypothetical protein